MEHKKTPKFFASPAQQNLIALWLEYAKQGDPNAQLSLGICHIRGEGVEQSLMQAAQYFYNVANQGSTEAAFLLSLCCFDDPKIAEVYHPWFELNKESSEQAKFYLGFCYFRERKYDLAAKIFYPIAETGHVSAQFCFAMCCYNKRSIVSGFQSLFSREDKRSFIIKANLLAEKYMRLAADAGDSQAQYILGMLLLKGEMGIERNFAEAYRWFKLAAENGSLEAQACVRDFAYEYHLGFSLSVAWGNLKEYGCFLKKVKIFTDAFAWQAKLLPQTFSAQHNNAEMYMNTMYPLNHTNIPVNAISYVVPSVQDFKGQNSQSGFGTRLLEPGFVDFEAAPNVAYAGGYTRPVPVNMNYREPLNSSSPPLALVRFVKLETVSKSNVFVGTEAFESKKGQVPQPPRQKAAKQGLKIQISSSSISSISVPISEPSTPIIPVEFQGADKTHATELPVSSETSVQHSQNISTSELKQENIPDSAPSLNESKDEPTPPAPVEQSALINKAADPKDSNYVQKQYRLGLCYEYGKKIKGKVMPISLQKALAHYKKAKAQGHGLATEAYERVQKEINDSQINNSAPIEEANSAATGASEIKNLPLGTEVDVPADGGISPPELASPKTPSNVPDQKESNQPTKLEDKETEMAFEEGLAAYRLMRYSEAFGHFKKVDNLLGNFYCGVILKEDPKGSVFYMDEGDVEKYFTKVRAEEDFFLKSPETARELFHAALYCEYFLQKYSEADDYYVRAAVKGDVQSKIYMGNAYIKKNKDDPKGWEFLDSAVRSTVKEDEIEAMYYLGYQCVYSSKDAYQRGMSLLILSANAGHARALYEIGQYNLVHEEFDKAFQNFFLSAEAGYLSAWYRLSECYWYGWGVQKDPVEARRRLILAASKGDKEAQVFLDKFKKEEEESLAKQVAEQSVSSSISSSEPLQGKPTTVTSEPEAKSASDSKELLAHSEGKKAFEKGFAAHCLGGDVTAFDHFEESAKHGEPLGHLYYGFMLDMDLVGTSASEEVVKAMAKNHLAKAREHRDSFLNGADTDTADVEKLRYAGVYCHIAAIDEADKAKALTYLSRAAQKGDLYSKVYLGKCYLNMEGEGAEEMQIKGKKLLGEAAKAGDADALYKLGRYSIDDKDYDGAFANFKSSAKKGHLIAAYWLARCHWEEWGTPKNSKEAKRILKPLTAYDENAETLWEKIQKAEEPQRVEIAFNLANLLYEQENAKKEGKDYKEVMQYLELPVKHKHTGALYLLGKCYFEKENYQEANKMLTQALLQKHPKAAALLKQCRTELQKQTQLKAEEKAEAKGNSQTQPEALHELLGNFNPGFFGSSAASSTTTVSSTLSLPEVEVQQAKLPLSPSSGDVEQEQPAII